MDPLQVAEELCRMVDQPSLLAWLDLPADADSAHAREALRVRRRKLQALQGNAKHRDVARLVITKFQVLDGLLVDVASYRRAVDQARVRAQLPLLDMGVDGILADGTVTEDELAFLEDAARRMKLDPELALGRLRARAEAAGVPLASPRPSASRPQGKRHPLLPTGWWDVGVARWLSAQLPPGARRLVELRCGDGSLGVSLASLRPELQVLGFDTEEAVAQAERAFDGFGIDTAVALPAAPTDLPLEDGAADAALFLLESPTDAERAEARRVVGVKGAVLAVTAGVPRATLGGPLPSMDAALWALCQAAGLPERVGEGRPVSTFVVTRTLADGPALGALLLSRVAALQRQAGLGDGHEVVRAAAASLEALLQDPTAAAATYEVPLTARRL